MPRFVFRLEVLLKQRRREQRERQLVVAELEQERLGLEDELRERQKVLAQSRADLRALFLPASDGAARFQAEQLKRGAAVAVAADRSARSLAIQLAGVHKRLGQAREQLRLADIRLKVVEELKERQQERFRLEQNRREAAAMDELAVSRAGRPVEIM